MGAGKERKKKSELNPFFDLSKGLRVVALVRGDAGACECVA